MRALRALGHPLVALAILLVLANLLLLPLVARAHALGGLSLILCEGETARETVDVMVAGGGHDGPAIACEAGCQALGAALAAPGVPEAAPVRVADATLPSGRLFPGTAAATQRTRARAPPITLPA